MGNIPVIHEFVTCVQSLGDAIAGDTKSARKRWDTYAKESVIGSTVAGIYYSARNEKSRAKEYFKGTGRAFGKAILGGGILKSVPLFHELATAGESLGDVIGGGDTKSARQRWKNYAENSVIGSFCYAIHESRKGREEHARKLMKNSGKALINAGATVAAIALTSTTAGLAAPLGMGAAALAAGSVGATTSVASTYLGGKLSGEKISTGDYFGAALMGGIGGALQGAMEARTYNRTMQALEQGERMIGAGEDAVEMSKARNDGAEGTVSSKMYSKEGDTGSVGYNTKTRGKMIKESGTIPKKLRNTTNMTPDEIAHYQKLSKMKDGPLGNATGDGTWFPKGTPNVDAAKANPNVQSALGDNVSRPIHNCAEPHALEIAKNANPSFVPGENYTLEIKNAVPVVKPPCNNCAAMGNVSAYGQVPFADYGGMSYADAALAKLNSTVKTGGLEQVAGHIVQAGSVDAPNPTPLEEESEKEQTKNSNTLSTNTNEITPLLSSAQTPYVGASAKAAPIGLSPISSLASAITCNDDAAKMVVDAVEVAALDVGAAVVDTIGYVTLGPVYGLIKLFK